jgi:WD40 repeat protein
MKLWDVATGRVVRSLNANEGWGSPVAFSPDGKVALSRKNKQAQFGEMRGHLLLWDVASAKSIRRLEGELNPLSLGPVLFTPDGKRVLAWDRDYATKPPKDPQYTVKVWDAARRGFRNTIPLT